MNRNYEQARADYESAVHGLRAIADAMLARGVPEPLVARRVVDRRNALKAQFRIGVDPRVLALIEARNLAKYGDPIGPSLDYLHRSYGSWSAVISAACRPADLSGGDRMNILPS